MRNIQQAGFLLGRSSFYESLHSGHQSDQQEDMYVPKISVLTVHTEAMKVCVKRSSPWGCAKKLTPWGCVQRLVPQGKMIWAQAVKIHGVS